MNKIKEMIKGIIELISYILEHYIELDMYDSKKNKNK